MANDTVTDERLEAGRDYLESLGNLGLKPEALVWTIPADRHEDTDLRLCMVSILVERYGPAEIYDLLYTAYERAGTPKSIDPWVVSLYGPGTTFARDLARAVEIADVDALAEAADGSTFPIGKPWIRVADRIYQPGWVYVRNFRKPDYARDAGAMDRLRRNVQALAA